MDRMSEQRLADDEISTRLPGEGGRAQDHVPTKDVDSDPRDTADNPSPEDTDSQDAAPLADGVDTTDSVATDADGTDSDSDGTDSDSDGTDSDSDGTDSDSDGTDSTT